MGLAQHPIKKGAGCAVSHISIYGVEREKLREALKGRRVCLTMDTWTSIQNLNYMSLIGHFIDDDWNLHKRILNFVKWKTIGGRL